MQAPLYTAAEMKDAEAGHDVRELMERAGRAIAEEALRHFPDAKSFAAVCGGGANGGDARIALEALRAAGREADEGLDGDVIIDGLFGTGFHGEPRADASEVIAQMNAAEGPVLSVDLPSGVDADTGEVAGAAVWASVTVALHAPKVGNVVAPGSFHGGDLVVRDIGLEHSMPEHALVTTTILGLVPRKGPSARSTARRCSSSAVRRGSRALRASRRRRRSGRTPVTSRSPLPPSRFPCWRRGSSRR